MPTRKISGPADIKKCQHPEHNVPMNQFFEPGTYEHECPSCGNIIRFAVPEPSLKSNFEKRWKIGDQPKPTMYQVKAETNNIIDGILNEIDRVQELVLEYESLPSGAGMLGAALMKQSIAHGKKVISSGDAIEALRAYADLQSHTG